MYTGVQASLLVQAARLAGLGYQVGYAKGKSLAGKYQENTTGWFGNIYPTKIDPPAEWDGISLLLEGIVCVDFDTDFHDIGWRRPLPPTFKERSPRGYHLYYQLPAGVTGIKSKIKWQSKVDLLCPNIPGPLKVTSAIDKIADDSFWSVGMKPAKTTKYVQKMEVEGKVEEVEVEWGSHVLCNPTPGYKLIYPDVIPERTKLEVAPDWLIEELQK